MLKSLSLLFIQALLLLAVSQPLGLASGATQTAKDSDSPGSYDLLMQHNAQAMALMRKGQIKAAIAEWRYVCDAEPNDVVALGGLGECLQATGDMQGAVKIYSRSLQLNPTYGSVLMARSACYESLHQHVKALADRKLFEKYGYNEATMRTIVQVQSGLNSEEAISRLKVAINRAPGCPDLYTMLMTFLGQAGQNAEAIEVAEKCLAISPVGSWNWRGAKVTESRASFAMGQYPAAKKYCEQALSNLKFGKGRRPEIGAQVLSEALLLKSEIEHRLGDDKEAIAALTLLIDNHAPDPAFYVKRATLYAAGKHDAQALADYTQAIKVAPSRMDTYQKRSALLIVLKRYNEAISDLSKLIEKHLGDDSNYFQRAQLYARLGQYQKAVDDYSEAIELTPDEAALYQARAALLRKLGRPALATADDAAAKKLDDKQLYRYRFKH